MSGIKDKNKKSDVLRLIRKAINKNSETILAIFLIFMIVLVTTIEIRIDRLNLQLEKYTEESAKNNKEMVNKLEDLVKELEKYQKVKIGRENFTEIYMQLQELTGMISNESKREYYITKAVKDISKNNSTLDSKSIYEISKTIYEEAVRYNFNPLLITALIKTESNFDPEAVSDSYAYGLCQVRRFIAPELAENIGIKWEGAEKTLFDPIKNIKIGVYYLSMLNRNFSDLKIAIIAYNQGPYNVQERLTNNQELSDNYVNKVLDYYANLRGFSLEEVQNEIKATD